MSVSERTIVLFNVVVDGKSNPIDFPIEAERVVEELCKLCDHLPWCAAAHMYEYKHMASFVFSTKEDAATAMKLMQADAKNWDRRTDYVSAVFLLSDLEQAQERIKYCLKNDITYADCVLFDELSQPFINEVGPKVKDGAVTT